MSATATPAWLLQGEVGLCPCGCIGKRRKGSFVAKTVEGATGVLRRTLFAEDTASSPGVLQRVDARVKVVTLLGLLVVVALVQSVPVLVVTYVATVALAAACRLSLRHFMARVWLFVPLFTGIVVLPATLNLVTDGDIVVSLGTWFGHPVGLTAQGLTGAALITLRVACSISLVVLLTLTTPWTRLLAALRSLFVPRMFVLVLGMAYRYVFHLLSSVVDMYTARRARSVGDAADARSGRAFVAATAGALFGKTHALAEDVHMAMVARGYTGNARSIETARLGPADLVWAVVAVLAGMSVLGLDRVV